MAGNEKVHERASNNLHRWRLRTSQDGDGIPGFQIEKNKDTPNL